MFNYATKKVIMTRNIIWLDKNYSEYKGLNKVTKVQLNQGIEYEDEGEEQEGQQEAANTKQEAEKAKENAPVAAIPRELRNLDTF